MKKLYLTLLLLFLCAISAVGAVSLLDKDPTRSISENRELAKLPDYSWQTLSNGKYIAGLDAYYTDTFPGRESLLRYNKLLNRFYYYTTEQTGLIISYENEAEKGGESLDAVMDAIGKPTPAPVEQEKPEEPAVPARPETPSEPEEPERPEEPEVPQTPEEPELPEEPEVPQEPVAPGEPEEPEDQLPAQAPEELKVGTILLEGDRAMDIPTATNSVIDTYAQALNDLAATLPGVRVVSLLTPNGGQFYSPEDFHTGVHDQQAMIERAYGGMQSSIVTVDAYHALEAHQDEYLFFRTDHHWTPLGAYYAYTALCGALGFDAPALDAYETGSYENFLGTMYTYTSAYPQSEALKNNPDTLTYYLPLVWTRARYYLDTDLTDGVPISVVYAHLDPSVSNKYLCLIGGDHAVTIIETDVDGPVCMVVKESYGNALVPFLTSHYSKIVVIDPREFNQDEKPELVLAPFAQAQGVDDLIVINYPFMISNGNYIGLLNALAGK